MDKQNQKSKKSKDCLDTDFIKKNIDILIKSMHAFNIDNPNRIKYFLAQCYHETGGFKHFNENLNYSAKGLLKVFPRHFDKSNVNSYARKPDKIADKVYGNRYGNTKPGDGSKYKGRGLIQITFKDNYKKIKNLIKVDIVNHPELVSDNNEVAIKSACAFFDSKNLNKYADKNDMEKISKTIQGSLVSLNDRNKALKNIENSDIYKNICSKMEDYKKSLKPNTNPNINPNNQRDKPINNDIFKIDDKIGNFKDINKTNSNIITSNTNNGSARYFSLDNRDIYLKALKEQIIYQKSKENNSNGKNNDNSYLNLFPPEKRNILNLIGPHNNGPHNPSFPFNPNKPLGGIDFSNIDNILQNCRNIKFQGLLSRDKLFFFNKKNVTKSNNESVLVNLEDLAVFLKILYDPTIKNKVISFSLDPFEPTKPDGPYMRKVFYPDEIEKKQILQGTKVGEDMFLADYLMKQMSIGYKPDNKTKFNYPKNLASKGLKPIHLLSGLKINRCRAWVITKKVESIKRKSGIYYIDGIKLGVDAREMEISNNGTLKDKKVQNENATCYKFSKTFSDLYDEIGKYYPIFDRLKEITGALVLAKYIYENRYPIDFNLVEQIYKSTLIPNYQIKINSIHHFEQKSTSSDHVLSLNEAAEKYLIDNNMIINDTNLEMAKNYINNNKMKITLRRMNSQTISIIGGIDLWSGIIKNEENILNESFNSLSTNNDENPDIKILNAQNDKLNIDFDDCNFFEFPLLVKNQKCTICGINLTLTDIKNSEQFKNKYQSANYQYCSKHNPFNCSICKKLVNDGPYFSFENKSYHQKCLKCIYCSKNFDNELSKNEEGFIHKECLEDFNNYINEKNMRYIYDNSIECEFCEDKIFNESYRKFNNYNFHNNCFEKIIKKGIDPGKNYIFEGCEFKCYICKKIILSENIKTDEGLSHIECFNFIRYIIYLCYLYYNYK